MTTRIGKYFSLEELTVSDSAARRGIRNIPSARELANLKSTAAFMDAIREELGKPILVTSGYRSPEVNALVKGSKTSAHVRGLAIDFTCPGFGTPLEVARHIAKMGMPFDQIIHEFGSWVHIGFAEAGHVPRKQLLTINKRGTIAGLS